jgi:hypothetical protein
MRLIISPFGNRLPNGAQSGSVDFRIQIESGHRAWIRT